MARSGVTRPEQKVINRAAQVAQNRINGTGGGGSASTPAPAREVTEEGVDADGNIITRHPMIWGVDKWGDPASLWSKP